MQVTSKDVTQIVKCIKVNFDNAYRLNDEDMLTLVESWKAILSAYPRDIVMTAASNVIANADITPRIGHIVKEVKRIIAAAGKSDFDLWNELIEAVDKAADLARKFRYTFREANGRTQGENARDDVIDLFNRLDPVNREFCGNPSGLLQLAKQDEDQLLYERSRFFQRATDMRERVIIRGNITQLTSGMTSIAELMGGKNDTRRRNDT